MPNKTPGFNQEAPPITNELLVLEGLDSPTSFFFDGLDSEFGKSRAELGILSTKFSKVIVAPFGNLFPTIGPNEASLYFIKFEFFVPFLGDSSLARFPYRTPDSPFLPLFGEPSDFFLGLDSSTFGEESQSFFGESDFLGEDSFFIGETRI